MGGGQPVVIDAVDDGEVDALGGGGYEDFLRASSEMGSGLVAVREEAGAFQRDVDAVGAVGQAGRIALGGNLDAAAVDDQVGAVGADFAGPGAVNQVALEQQRVEFGIGEVVDRHQLEPAILLFEDGTGDEAADPPKPIDRNSGHSIGSFTATCFCNLSKILGTIASTVNPKCRNKSSAGADAPKRSRPRSSPWRPV